jgi:hypothetical protein
MRKLLALILAVIMTVPVGLLSPSATETDQEVPLDGKIKISDGCSYTYTGKHIYQANGTVVNPDSDTTPKLTDGAIGSSIDADMGGKVWVGVNIEGENYNKLNNSNSIVLDLGAQKDKLSKFCLYTLHYNYGIRLPNSVRVYISNDNNNFSYIGTAECRKILNSSSFYSHNPDDGIYAFILSSNYDFSGRYIKFEVEHFAYPWVLISEVEVYQSTTLPEAVNYSLLSYNTADWKSGPAQNGETASVSSTDNAVVISGSKNASPYAYYDIKSPVTVNIADYYINYDFTVSGGETNIVLYCEGSTAESGANFIADITHLIAPEGSDQRPSGDNLKAGAYSGKINLSDLNLKNVSLKESEKLSISAVKVFSVNGGIITFNKLKLEEIIPEIDSAGFDSTGIGYYIDEILKSAMIYTTVNSPSGSIILPEKIKREGVTYPVKYISLSAFKNCKNITQITIPEGYLSIGKNAFNSCTSLQKVSLPASLYKMDGNPFTRCESLSEINIDKNSKSFVSEDNVVFNKNKDQLIIYAAGKTESDYSIPDCVSSITDYAFDSAIHLLNVHIPDNVDYYGDGAFNYSSITSVSFPESVTYIISNIFDYCPNLETVNIPKTVTSIYLDAFTLCPALLNVIVDNDNPVYSSSNGIIFSKNGEELVFYPQGKDSSTYTIPSNVKKIRAKAFANNKNIETLIVPESVEQIGFNAFYKCTALSDIRLPDTLIKIDSSAFDLTKWYSNQPDGVVYIGKIVYGYKGNIPENSPLSLTLKDDTLGIADYAFAYLNVGSVSLPDSLLSIGEGSFEYCENLTSIEVPDNVTFIDQFAFAYCSNLKNVVLSGNLKEIADCAFYECKVLEELFIPKTVIKFGDNVFAYCKNLILILYSHSPAMKYAIDFNIPFALVQERTPLLTFSDGYVINIQEKLKCADVLADYASDIIIMDYYGTIIEDLNTPITTGYNIYHDGYIYAVAIAGDIDGDGIVDATDYYLVKKAIIGTYELNDAYLRAACIASESYPDSSDYMLIKKHVLGNYNLYKD